MQCFGAAVFCYDRENGPSDTPGEEGRASPMPFGYQDDLCVICWAEPVDPVEVSRAWEVELNLMLRGKRAL